MFTHYRTLGFVIKKTDRGEADRFFTIYTEKFGKLELLAKAERKINSKLRSGLELFYLSEIEFIQGKANKTLTDALVIEKFDKLRNDLISLNIAYKASEVLDNLIKGQEPDEEIWQLIDDTFKKLNISHLEIIYYYFFWNLLSILGYQPDLYNCSICQEKLTPEKIYLNIKEGGLICQNCFKKVKSGKEISPEIVKILRLIIKRNWPILSKLRVEEKDLKSLEAVSELIYSYLKSQ